MPDFARSTFALFPRQRFDIGAKSLEKTGGFCISAGANVREDVAQSAFSKAYEIARKNKVISIGIEKSAKVEVRICPVSANFFFSPQPPPGLELVNRRQGNRRVEKDAPIQYWGQRVKVLGREIGGCRGICFRVWVKGPTDGYPWAFGA